MTLTVGATANVIISGHVKAADGTGIGGVILDGLPRNPVTDDSGYYMASANPGWSGTVRPTIGGRTFDPKSRKYGAVRLSATGEDYTAGQGGIACPMAGFGPMVLWMCVMGGLMRSRGRQLDAGPELKA